MRVRHARRTRREDDQRITREACRTVGSITEIERSLRELGFTHRQRQSIMGEVTAYVTQNAHPVQDMPVYDRLIQSLSEECEEETQEEREKLH